MGRTFVDDVKGQLYPFEREGVENEGFRWDQAYKIIEWRKELIEAVQFEVGRTLGSNIKASTEDVERVLPGFQGVDIIHACAVKVLNKQGLNRKNAPEVWRLFKAFYRWHYLPGIWSNPRVVTTWDLLELDPDTPNPICIDIGVFVRSEETAELVHEIFVNDEGGVDAETFCGPDELGHPCIVGGRDEDGLLLNEVA